MRPSPDLNQPRRDEHLSGPRYEACRAMGVDYMIHHRVELGCYLRELNLPLPNTYGLVADAR